MRFQYTYYLWALAVLPLLLLLFYSVVLWKKKTARKIGDAALVQELTRRYSPGKFALKFGLLAVAFALCVLAAANLRKPEGNALVTRNGIDVMLAVDVSKSMLAEDVKPNRLERARQLLTRLVDRLQNDRIGIVVFAGKAYMQMPLTADHGSAKLFLSSISTDMVPTQGTVISDALKMCFAAFPTREKKYKTVILLSDGEDHDEAAEKTAAAMAEDGIIVHTVGFGSPDGAPIMDAATHEMKKDKDGNTVISKLNEKGLQSIATSGNGTYQLFASSDAVVNKLDQQFSSMGQRAVTEASSATYRYFFYWFLALALALLLGELLVSENKGRWWAKPQLAVLAMALLLNLPAQAQQEKKLLVKGNQAYTDKSYDTAAMLYKQVTDKNSGNGLAQYNLGNALYKAKKAEASLDAYDKALQLAKTPAEISRIYYNKGVVLQNEKKLPECIDAYKRALKLTPEDSEARLNLQKALQQQKKQEQEQKKDKQKQKPKEDDKQKEKEKPKDEEKNDRPKPQPSRLNKKEAEERLKALMQQEKNLQEKLRKVNPASIGKPDKDW